MTFLRKFLTTTLIALLAATFAPKGSKAIDAIIRTGPVDLTTKLETDKRDKIDTRGEASFRLGPIELYGHKRAVLNGTLGARYVTDQDSPTSIVASWLEDKESNRVKATTIIPMPLLDGDERQIETKSTTLTESEGTQYDLGLNILNYRRAELSKDINNQITILGDDPTRILTNFEMNESSSTISFNPITTWGNFQIQYTQNRLGMQKGEITVSDDTGILGFEADNFSLAVYDPIHSQDFLEGIKFSSRLHYSLADINIYYDWNHLTLSHTSFLNYDYWKYWTQIENETRFLPKRDFDKTRMDAFHLPLSQETFRYRLVLAEGEDIIPKVRALNTYTNYSPTSWSSFGLGLHYNGEEANTKGFNWQASTSLNLGSYSLSAVYSSDTPKNSKDGKYTFYFLNRNI